MKRILLSLILLGCSVSVAPADDTLARSFALPPPDARPWVFWFWPDGNMTRTGITADLEAMARVGIGGVLIMEVAHGTPKGPVEFASPQWRELFGFALTEAKRLGLQVNMNNDAGWTGSAGPWITPELAMQKLTMSETQAAGGKVFDAVLPQPETVKDFYRDVAVLAFPMPTGDNIRATDGKLAASASTSVANAELIPERVLDGNPKTRVALPRPEADKPQWVQLDFPQPFVARTITLGLVGNTRFGVHGEVQVSDDGKAFRTLREFDAQPPTTVINIPETGARCFRLLFTKGLHPRLEKVMVSEFDVSPAFRLQNLAAKAAFISTQFTTERNVPSLATWPEIARDLAVPSDLIFDLSAQMDATGRLKWDAPPGNWTILRIGYTLTGRENHPAPGAGIGLECDKLSKEAARAAFDGFIGRLATENAALAGPEKTLVSTHVDSWEVGSQNWTPRMREEFKRLRGYDPLLFLPVISGRVVDSIEVSERFLWDLRQTISDLVQQNYGAELRRLANERGMRFSVEGYFGVPSSEVAYGGQADEPMAEFWWTEAKGGHYSALEMTSAAHIYGRPIVGAESFTAGEKERWLWHPAKLKDLGDWAFCQGINRFVIHRYSMQPWLDLKPGTSMGMWGLHYERTQTWWEQSRGWHEYLARCQLLLRQGLFVADVCYLEPEGITRSVVPASLRPANSMERPGYNFDLCPPDALLTRASVKDGRIVFPDGMSYRVLLLPEVETMTPELLRKIRDLVAAGATVLGPARPKKSPSLRNYPHCDDEVRRLAADLWDGGKISTGQTPAEFFAGRKVGPDFSSSGDSKVRYVHRTTGDAEIYFVATKSQVTETILATFRVAGRRPEFWWPDTGRIERPAVYDETSEGISVPIPLEPSGSVFVIFRAENSVEPDRIVSVAQADGQTILAANANNGEGEPTVWVTHDAKAGVQVSATTAGIYRLKTAAGTELAANVPTGPATREVTGPWSVEFDPKLGGPAEPVQFVRPGDWSKHTDDRIRFYAGTAGYRTVFRVEDLSLWQGETTQAFLDLGKVAVMVDVKLNGRPLGILWKPPFRVEVTGLLRAGENVLELVVANLWPNRMIGDEALPEDSKRDPKGTLTEWPQWLIDGKANPTGRVSFTTWRLWKEDEPLIESGLIGPVTLQARKQAIATTVNK